MFEPRQRATLWGERIAKAYAEKSSPRLLPPVEKALAQRLADKLTADLTNGIPSADWPERLNKLLEEWEEPTARQGPRIATIDEVAETVEMKPATPEQF